MSITSIGTSIGTPLTGASAGASVVLGTWRRFVGLNQLVVPLLIPSKLYNFIPQVSPIRKHLFGIPEVCISWLEYKFLRDGLFVSSIAISDIHDSIDIRINRFD